MTYQELLQDPRWQKKRLLIFERDGWRCQCCESTDRTLHAHHKRYIHGNLPWEYDDKDLVTLCEFCHEVEEKFKRIRDPFIEAFTHDGREWLRFKFFEEINSLRLIREKTPLVYAEIMTKAKEHLSTLDGLKENSLPILNRLI